MVRDHIHKLETVRPLRPRFRLFLLLTTLIGAFLMGVPAYAAQVSLAWNRNTEPDIAGYRIYYGTGTRAYNWFIDVGNVTQYTITDLANGSTYYLAATAYNTSNIESAYSAEVIYTGCTYSISPTKASIAEQGGTGTLQVITQAGCSWTARSGASWLTITSGNAGTGNGMVTFSATSNTDASVRTATSTIAGNTFTVTQAGSNPTSTASKSYSINASAGTGGYISPSGTVTLSQGTNKTFSITPAKGYRISKVSVDGVSVGAVSTYTFSNINRNHTIFAAFQRVRR